MHFSIAGYLGEILSKPLYASKIMRGCFTVKILITAALYLLFCVTQTTTKCEPVNPTASGFEHQTFLLDFANAPQKRG